jgi:hypothetical protein
LKLLDQRWPKREWTLWFLEGPNDIDGKIILSEPIFDFQFGYAPAFGVDRHIKKGAALRSAAPSL